MFGPAVVHQEPDARLYERRPRHDGDERFVLQLHVYGGQRDRVECRGRRERIQNVQDVRCYMPCRPCSHHHDVRNKRPGRRESCRRQPMLANQRSLQHVRISVPILMCLVVVGKVGEHILFLCVHFVIYV